MYYLPIVLVVGLGVIFWFLDNFWNLLGKQFLEGFFFAGGLHPGEQYIYIVLLSLINIIIIIFSFARKQSFQLSPALGIYSLLCISMAISTFLSSVDIFESLREFWIYTLTFSISFYAYNFVLSQKDKEEFLYNYSLLLLTLFIIVILIAVIVSLGLPSGSPWMSLFYQKNAFGGFILMFIPIAFSLSFFSLIYMEYTKAILFFVAFIFGVFSLIFSASKASLLSFIISLPFYLSFLRLVKIIDWKTINKEIKFLFTGLVSFSLFLLALQLILDKKFTTSLINSIKSIIFGITNTVIARVDFWESSLKIAKDFIFGCGLYNFSKLYPLYQATFYYYSKDPHNYYLKILSETGYPTFFLFILLVVYFLYLSANLYKKVNLKLITTQEYKQNIAKDLNQMDPNFRQNLSKLGTYILSSGISIGLIQSLIHIAFDVDFKFSYILIVFLLNFFVNMAILESFEKERTVTQKLNFTFFIWVLIFLPLSLYTLFYSIKEAKAYKIEKQVEKTGNYKLYIQAIKNSLPSSSKYVTLAELYRANSNYEETIKCNKRAIKLCKYNINAYLSLAYLYNDQLESLSSINTADYQLKEKIKNKVRILFNDIKYLVFESFKYDNKNYPDIYILLAKSYEYINSKNYKKLYKHIFQVVYPPQEYINLMDIRYTTFGDVIAESYVRYLIEDFIECQKDKKIEVCQKIANYLYDPIVKYKIKTDVQEFYVIGALSHYITAKELYNIDYKKSLENFRKAKNILEITLRQTPDLALIYYYTNCQLYLNDYDNALELAKKIFSIPLDTNLPSEEFEKLKIVKINNYSILAEIYSRKNLKNLARKYAELYKKYRK